MVARRAVLAVFSFGTNRTLEICYRILTMVIVTLGVRDKQILTFSQHGIKDQELRLPIHN